MSKKDVDYYKQGKEDRENPTLNSWVDGLLHGGQSAHYDPPKGKGEEAKAGYNEGWNDTKKNR